MAMICTYAASDCLAGCYLHALHVSEQGEIRQDKKGGELARQVRLVTADNMKDTLPRQRWHKGLRMRVDEKADTENASGAEFSKLCLVTLS